MLATVASFIPPAIPFVMVLRVTASSEPIAAWQVALSIVWGFTWVAIFLWAGAKIFRVGVLMQGKPPTPRELLTKLNLEINRALNQAELKAEFARVGFDTTPRSPAEFNTYMRAESARWAKVIKEADIRVS